METFMEERINRLEQQVERLYSKVTEARSENSAYQSEIRDLFRDLRREVNSDSGFVIYVIGLACVLSFVLLSSSCSLFEGRLDRIQDAVNDVRWKS
jgi:hypothetical protein